MQLTMILITSTAAAHRSTRTSRWAITIPVLFRARAVALIRALVEGLRWTSGRNSMGTRLSKWFDLILDARGCAAGI